ncbi:MAG: tRNA (adenosine(37)-N6)-threonylcarbamoyltransferase complex transferase subunit TsaD [Candidatus Yanofskybacteria bacterium]|nr:tRNA (adenosine(37)-N6)-threonylcarbamoyltransferase complex transferase subunit TsaD [Candidatus Yanofskybacteria bacterium]
MKILGIETSCDDTAMAILEVQSKKRKVKSGEKIKVLSSIVSSQVKLHAKYGGIVPSLAAREHTKNIGHVFDLALEEADVKNFNKEIDAIAVTRGPGLGPSLLVGITFAKTLSWIFKKPLIGVNHLEGHIYSNWLEPVGVSSKFKVKSEKLFPILNLIVSGGHTELALMKNYGKYEIIGETLDDAVGEAFDKTARLLGLGYPGGPAIAARAAKFKVESSKLKVVFPRPMEHSNDFNFSYSGLKTAVLYLLRDLKAEGGTITDDIVNEIAHEFQEAATDVLVKKTMKAAEKYKVKSLFLSGGVSANSLLRLNLNRATAEAGVKYFQPPMEYTTDNAAMIAVAGYFNYLKNKKIRTAYDAVEMDANLGF